jgi:hypothetical protein
MGSSYGLGYRDSARRAAEYALSRTRAIVRPPSTCPSSLLLMPWSACEGFRDGRWAVGRYGTTIRGKSLVENFCKILPGSAQGPRFKGFSCASQRSSTSDERALFTFMGAMSKILQQTYHCVRSRVSSLTIRRSRRGKYPTRYAH